jgi:hypothetical protein
MIKFLQILLPSIFTTWFTPSLSGIASAVGIASGVNSLMGGGGGGNTGGGQYYDPYASERPQYFAKLKELTGMGDQGNKGAINTVLNSPGYAGGLQQGERTLGRNLARTGQTESGAEKLAYSNLGQDYFTQQYQNLFNMYSGLSGATQAPLNMASQNQLNASQNQAGWGAIAQGVGGLGKATSSIDTANATWLPTAFQDTSQPFTSNWGNL